MIMAKELKSPPMDLGQQIKLALNRLSNSDGLKRTQRWLAMQMGIGEVLLSNKIRNNDFTKEELDNINLILMSNIG